MSLLQEILDHNAHFVADRDRPLSKHPARRMALFTCMDTRLVEFLEPAMGIGRGDAKVVKNAGNTLTDPGSGMIKSLIVAIFALSCDEVLVIGHQDCGMAQLDENELRRRMLARGVPASALEALKPGLREWLGGFQHPVDNVLEVVDTIRQSPLIPRDVPIHGLIFDPVSGRLELLTSGYDAAVPSPPAE